MYGLFKRVRTGRIFPLFNRKPDLTLETNMLYSITYDIIEAPEEGEEVGPDPDESGYEIEEEEDDLESIIREAESYGCDPGISGSNPWYSEGQIDMQTGDTTSYAAHIKWPDGTPLTQFEVNQINMWWDQI